MLQILKQLEEGVATITFNNSSRRNVITRAMVEEVTGAIDEFVASQARVVILRAVQGSKVWSAGHDVGELPLPGCDPPALLHCVFAVNAVFGYRRIPPDFTYTRRGYRRA